MSKNSSPASSTSEFTVSTTPTSPASSLSKPIAVAVETLASPFLCDFDRYPVSGGERQHSLNDSVSKIMSTVPQTEKPAKQSRFRFSRAPTVKESTPPRRRSSVASNSSASSIRTMATLSEKLSSGQIKISGPEGFTHVSSMSEDHVRPRQQPQLQRAIETHGPPIKSYRDSMALRSISSESHIRQNSSHSTSSSLSGNSNPPIPANGGTIYGYGYSHNRTNTNSSSGGSSPPPRPQAPRLSKPPASGGASANAANNNNSNSKRASRLPWKRAPQEKHSIPSISEPILEYSTSELIPDSRMSRSSFASLPLSELYPHGLPSGSLNQYPGPPVDHNHQHSESMSSTVSSSTRSTSLTTISPKSNTLSVRQSHKDSPGASTANSPTSPKPPSIPIPAPPMSDYEVSKWRQKLRESEDKRRAMMIEYQQKLDAERKRTMELERKLETMIREKATASVNDLPNAAASKDPQIKIKALETQRDVLRQALNTLRQTKDMEIAQYKKKLFKVSSAKPATKRSAGLDEADVPSNPKRYKDPIRIGIAPLLPTSNPYDIRATIKELRSN
ncbi:hypothetical protein TRVA0_009S00518 [Trichomonascus vanleenenianus]|uniref:uncharacterized protein n=1 Tax=Trichomonascus vanleenenianus TaxID=2268995 RepID=UPI003ECB5FBB